MSAVARVLFDHVQVYPPQIDVAAPPGRCHSLIERVSVGELSRSLADGEEVLDHLVESDTVEVIEIGVLVRVAHIVGRSGEVGERRLEPHLLHDGHMAQ